MRLILKTAVAKKGYELPTEQVLDAVVTETKRIQVKVPGVEEDVWLNVKKTEIDAILFDPKEVDLESFA